MIKARGLTKWYGAKAAVAGVSFEVMPGRVTGFLGPKGAVKSTTMRMIVGLDRPTVGTVTVNGKPYAAHAAPLREVGVRLDAGAVHPGRSAYQHLRAMAATHAAGNRRVREVLEMTGLDTVADKRSAGSWGWASGSGSPRRCSATRTRHSRRAGQWPGPEGVKWVRTMVRHLAGEGRTIFTSSHLMSEMAQTADHLLVIGRGRIITAGPIGEVVAAATQVTVRVVTPDSGSLPSCSPPEVPLSPPSAGVSWRSRT